MRLERVACVRAATDSVLRLVSALGDASRAAGSPGIGTAAGGTRGLRVRYSLFLRWQQLRGTPVFGAPQVCERRGGCRGFHGRGWGGSRAGSAHSARGSGAGQGRGRPAQPSPPRARCQCEAGRAPQTLPPPPPPPARRRQRQQRHRWGPAAAAARRERGRCRCCSCCCPRRAAPPR